MSNSCEIKHPVRYDRGNNFCDAETYDPVPSETTTCFLLATKCRSLERFNKTLFFSRCVWKSDIILEWQNSTKFLR